MSFSLKLRTLHHQHQERADDAAARLPTEREEWLLSAALLIFMTGLFMDGWAHNHIPELETFFTPWHAVFYSGYALTALTLLGIVWHRKSSLRIPFSSAIPHGYGPALFGALLFFLGGLGDMAWHEIFGVEADIEALLSPTHLMLACALFLMITSGLRVWFLAVPPLGVPSFRTQLPMLLSLSFVIALLWFMTQFSHFVTVRAGGAGFEDPNIADMSQNIAIGGALLSTAVLMGGVLLVLRRGRLATGGLTFVFLVTMYAMGVMRDGLSLLPAALVAGIVADCLAQRIHPLERHRTEVRIAGFLIPAVLFTGYFLTIHIQSGIWWTVHLWAGLIVMTGIVGTLVSFLVLPPADVA